MLDRIVAVFKPTEESGETLHAALMANHEIDRQDPKPQFEHMQVISQVLRAEEAEQKSVRLSQDHQALKAHLRHSSD